MTNTGKPDRNLDLARELRAAAAGEDVALDRADLELLGLLAEELPIERIPAELRARVLAAAVGRRLDGAPPVAPAPVAAPVRPAMGEARRRRVWRMSWAAALAVLSLGASAWLSLQVARQGDALSRMQGRLSQAEAQAASLSEERRRLEAQSELLAFQLARVTAPGVEVCPLRPTRRSELPDPPYALAFLVPHEKSWYLQTRGLEPPAGGGVYVLWFFGADGPTSGGALHVVGTTLSQGPLPEMSAMSQGMAITVERDAQVARPTGPALLFGADKIQLL